MNSTPTNPLCYSCKHRRWIPGDAHSSCAHPAADFLAILSGDNALGIKASGHGVRQGWFLWPVNFDPVWLENCNGYEAAKPAAETSEVKQ